MIIKEITNHEGYFIGEDGSVYKKMKPWLTKSGYRHIKLNGKHYDIHRLVAQEFVPNPSNLPVVNHIDGNRENNHYTNLEWCSQKENIQHYLNNGGSPVKNFVPCKLYKGNELIGEYISVMEASKEAERLGCSFSMINKHREHNGYRIVKG